MHIAMHQSTSFIHHFLRDCTTRKADVIYNKGNGIPNTRKEEVVQTIKQIASKSHENREIKGSLIA